MSVGGNGLRIQTSIGSLYFSLSGTTRITRIVTGSTADLATGQTVEAQFLMGSTTIRSIRIDLPHTAHGTPPARSSGTHDGDRSRTGSGASHSGPSRPPNGVDGQLVSMTDRTVTIKGERGQTATYALAGNVAVSKVLPGKLSDLAMGETVQVCTGRGNASTAVTVTILSS